MVVTDNYYIILDEVQSTIFFFDKSGKFLSSFNDKNIEITDMKLAYLGNQLFIQTKKKGFAFTERQKIDIIRNLRQDIYKLWVCDLNIRMNFQFKPVPDFFYSGYTLFPVAENDFLASVIFAGKGLSDQVSYELQRVKGNRVTENFFLYNQQSFTPYYDHLKNISFFNSTNDSLILFTRPYHYDIYSFSGGKVATKYQFVFPASQSLPADFFDRNLSDETSREIFRKEHQGAVQNILPVLSWNNHLVFWLSALQPNNMRDFRQYILDLNTNTLFNARMIAPDSVSYHLSINFTGLMASDDSSVYTFMFADELLETAKGKNESYPPGLQSFLKQNNANANPVLIRLIKK